MKKIRISMVALFALTAMGMSFTSFSEPGVQQRFICSIHNEEQAFQHGGGLTMSNSFAVCVDRIKNSPHFAEVEQKYLNGEITFNEKELHIPENCATLDPFY